jgi:hypothetical protein
VLGGVEKKKRNYMKAKEFDEIFEKSDISEFLDIEKSMDLDEFTDYLKKNRTINT